MAKKKQASTRLGVRYLDDLVLLTATHAWTYVKVPLLSYEFRSAADREAFADGIAYALAALVTSGSKPVEAHLRITHRPLDVDQWAEQLHERVARYGPAPGFNQFLGGMAQRVDSISFDRKEVYLGVNLGPRTGPGSPADATRENLGGVLEPLNKLASSLASFSGISDDVVSDKELAAWHERALDVHRTLHNSALRAEAATANDVAYLIARPWWPEMVQPELTAIPGKPWGAGEVRQLVEGEVTHHRRYLEVSQVQVDGQVLSGYTVSLAFSRFPDVLYFPDQEPWMHFAAALDFPVDFSTRLQVVPAMQVQKDIGRKLADARDQAEHIAGSGSSVPLKVREQLEVATALEYTIDKDRMPWSYARHRIMIHGIDAAQVTARAKTLIETYREIGIDLVWPTGDQLDLAIESMPGETVKAKSYYQRQELALIGGGMPTASSECGDTGDKVSMGPYLGYTTSRVATPVFYSPHTAMARNNPPGVAITGAPGGGKSFLAFNLAYQMAIQGTWVVYIDPKADATPMGLLPGLGKPKVFDMRDGADGMLDPFSLSGDKGATTMLAMETLRLLLGGQVNEVREEALQQAIEVVAKDPMPSLAKVVQVLRSSDDVAARNVGGLLNTISQMPFARLCFAPTGGAKLNPRDGLTVVTLLGLDLPPASMSPEDYSYENRLAVAVMYLLTRYARDLMLASDKSHPKAICIDEAWAITSTPQGAKLIPEIARMGRSHNTALVLVSQNAGDLMAESVTNSISTKFAFRSSIPGEIDDVLELFGLEKEPGNQMAIRNLRNGECLMQDVDGRVARVLVDAWNKTLFDAFNTNPETRGKAGG